MRMLIVFGGLLMVIGIAAVLLPSITFFTKERVADLGFFTIDISKPHTIIFNPLVGAILLGIGGIMVLVGFRSGSSSV